MTKPTGRPVGRPKGSGTLTARVELRVRPALLEKIQRAAEEDKQGNHCSPWGFIGAVDPVRGGPGWTP